mgnify:CR=1 FL=1
MDRLKEMGARIVIRSSRSRTPVDVIAIFPREKRIMLVQVKKGRSRLKPIEKRVLRELGGEYKVETYVYSMDEDYRYRFKRIA